MILRVVNLGLPKSGTTTLAKALRMSGLRVADHRIRGRNTDDPNLKGAFVGELMYRGYFETGDPAQYLPDVEAVSEMSMLRGDHSMWPQTDMALVRALKRQHPGVQFLASRRDAFAMSQSMLAWTNLGTMRLPASAVPGLPTGYGETSKQRETWIDGHYDTLRMHFHNDRSFLEFWIDDPEAPSLLADFLGRDMPWWGHLNANPLRESV